MISIRTTNGTKSVQALSIRTLNGTQKVASVYIRTTNGLVQVFSSTQAITVSPDTASGYGSSKGSARIYTNTLAVQGYSGKPTIAWAVPSGWTVVSQGSATTSFQSPPVAYGGEINDNGTVTVTLNGQASTAAFSLYASNQANS